MVSKKTKERVKGFLIKSAKKIGKGIKKEAEFQARRKKKKKQYRDDFLDFDIGF